ncbi:uncharacterized protein Ecym_6240 [Eremothecium cymbalariae DBVPG|uniref:RRM domain-containing protein n=1 Tax=Eremothecium cymbalariae (strain CBS 270.75 / DBVPG 7215 / KCTC 17166 / NRRL Y-17582) TaxID=931890 RepID=G8JVE3_ERECY|nr:hypothetical protein Ecym_6240 [Eremothecium cymbalariae DBVPG\
MGSSNTVHVSGFPRDTRARDMVPDFESIGKIVRIDIPPMRPFQDRPYAFVQFETSEECERAIDILDGRPFSSDSRFTYHVQLARSRPYPSGYNGNGDRGGKYGLGGPSSRGGILSGGYKGRDYRDQDPRDFRTGTLSRGVPGAYRLDGERGYKFREPREYRDREPLRAYESVRPSYQDQEDEENSAAVSSDDYIPPAEEGNSDYQSQDITVAADDQTASGYLQPADPDHHASAASSSAHNTYNDNHDNDENDDNNGDATAAANIAAASTAATGENSQPKELASREQLAPPEKIPAIRTGKPFQRRQESQHTLTVPFRRYRAERRARINRSKY